MRVVFLGVGEACDELLPNTAIWVTAESEGSRKSLLLDCGFTVPSLYWKEGVNQEDLDALWISHFHGDHFFGVPALLLRFWEMKRGKTLAVVGPPGIGEIITRAMGLAYPNFFEKLTYPVEFIEATTGVSMRIAGLTWRFAENAHSQRDLAVRIDDGKHSVFYSGDGLYTSDTLLLAERCDVAIHEAFKLDQGVSGHGSVCQCIEFGRRANVSTLALVHVQRDERRKRHEDILRAVEAVGDFRVLLAEPGDAIELP
jgi:ribonuclease BN (tRNA processing enzyme)